MLQKVREWSYKNRKKVILFIFASYLTFAASSFAGFPVSVINFPMLVSLMETQIAKVLTNKMDSLFQKELNLKRLAGILSSKNSQFSHVFENLAFEGYLQKVDNFVSDRFSSFSPDADLGRQTYDQVVSHGVDMPSLAEAEKNPSLYMEQSSRVATVLAGKPVTPPKSAEKDPSVKSYYLKRDLETQSNTRVYETASAELVVAQHFEDIVKKINPDSIDKAMPEQAVKDIAKLLYYNALLQAHTLKLLAVKEQRNSVYFAP